MKITVVGTGEAGLVTGASLAYMGNEVVCLDVDERRIALLAEALGADIDAAHQGIGSDHRVGSHFLCADMGIGRA